jgi:hypothetical protein
LEAGGSLSAKGAMGVLQRISMNDGYRTQWSVLYDLSSGDVDVAMGRNYRRVLSFKLSKSRGRKSAPR